MALRLACGPQSTALGSVPGRLVRHPDGGNVTRRQGSDPAAYLRGGSSPSEDAATREAEGRGDKTRQRAEHVETDEREAALLWLLKHRPGLLENSHTTINLARCPLKRNIGAHVPGQIFSHALIVYHRSEQLGPLRAGIACSKVSLPHSLTMLQEPVDYLGWIWGTAVSFCLRIGCLASRSGKNSSIAW